MRVSETYVKLTQHSRNLWSCTHYCPDWKDRNAPEIKSKLAPSDFIRGYCSSGKCHLLRAEGEIQSKPLETTVIRRKGREGPSIKDICNKMWYGAIVVPPRSVCEVPARGREARKRNLSIASNPVSLDRYLLFYARYLTKSYSQM